MYTDAMIGAFPGEQWSTERLGGGRGVTNGQERCGITITDDHLGWRGNVVSRWQRHRGKVNLDKIMWNLNKDSIKNIR